MDIEARACIQNSRYVTVLIQLFIKYFLNDYFLCIDSGHDTVYYNVNAAVTTMQSLLFHLPGINRGKFNPQSYK